MPGIPAPLHVRFWSKVDRAGECWEWTAAKDRKGYGRVWLGGNRTTMGFAHRVAYELEVGPVPADAFVCHHCDNPGCVNPEHLYLGDHIQNMRDMVTRNRNGRWQSRKTHCPKGHPYDEENTYWIKTGGRQCKTCARYYTRRWRTEQRAKREGAA